MVSVAPPRRGTTVIVVGRKQVGKTTLLRRVSGRPFDDTDQLIPTVKVGEKQTEVIFTVASDLSNVQEAIIIVFTIVELQDSDFWASVSEALKKHQTTPLPRYFILTKFDEDANRTDEAEALGKQKSEEFGAKFFRISSKTGEGLEEFVSTFSTEIAHVEQQRLNNYYDGVRQLQMICGTHPDSPNRIQRGPTSPDGKRSDRRCLIM